MKLYKIVLLIMFTILLFVISCSDRGVNYGKDDYAISEGSYLQKTGAHVFHEELLFQINNVTQQMRLVGYMPKAAFPIQYGGEFKPVPMLVLLPPQDGDAYFYFQHGLKEIADELISKGIIQPMGIICLPNDQIFGGYFFAGSSPAAGLYDDLLGGVLIDWAEDSLLPLAIGTKEKRAIGGIGMGAYGAFRAAMLNPDVFSSVSGVAGPMDFDGADNNSGFIPLFVEALNEQGIMGLNLRNKYKYQSEWYLSRLFIGGGFAFSSYDTLYNYNRITTNNVNTYTLNYSLSLDTLVFPLKNAISFLGFEKLPNPFTNALDKRNRFYLPFDSTGNVVTPVWNLWLNNNLPTIFANNSNAFDGVNVWIGNSSESTFGNYYSQTVSWVNTLKTAGVPVTEFNLKGYDGHPANKDQYVYDYIREMLIFHSEQFGN